jgi:hypothetical protein
MLGVSPWHVDALWRRGELQAYQIAGKGTRKYYENDVLALIKPA